MSTAPHESECEPRQEADRESIDLEPPMRGPSVASLGTEEANEPQETPSSEKAELRENLQNGLTVGDYDMKKSASTAAFMHEMMEDRYLNRTRQRLIPKLEGLAEERGAPRGVATALLASATEAVLEGVDAIGEDDFWKCFEKQSPSPWNWNWFLWPMWAAGLLFRYLVLFPIRVLILLGGWVCFGSGMLLIQLLFFHGPTREYLLRLMISCMSSFFVLTWSGVIRYHGHVPHGNGKTNVVFVANHTSLIDVIVLQQVRCFSLVGQRHKGMVRFLQDRVLGSLQCIWFDRAQMKDRAIVSKKLTEHAKDPSRNPLLVFPEGTCVNNRYVILFKKGAFELGCAVAPVAIRYGALCFGGGFVGGDGTDAARARAEKMFVDPFWSSRDQSFAMHLVELMCVCFCRRPSAARLPHSCRQRRRTSWCLIADVYFLEPTVRRDGGGCLVFLKPGDFDSLTRLGAESAEAFAQRVRNLIAERAGIKPVDWDGYLKHFMPSPRLLAQSRAVYADGFKRLLEEIVLAQRTLAMSASDDGDFFFGGTSPSVSVDGTSAPDAQGSRFVHAGSHSSAAGGSSFRPKLGPVVLSSKAASSSAKLGAAR
jgi:glycerol-3-phosphate O-acyltransferase 3/4